MANAMNKDQFILDYNKQRISFIEALKRFNISKGTPFDQLPEIGGREVDLYHLYQKVTGMGGFQKVNHEQLWEIIVEDFLLPFACTNAVEVLKHIYFRYLNLYEKVNYLGEEVDLRKNDDDDGPTRKKICLPIESIPLSYNYNQHKITDSQRQQYNLSTELLKRNPYEKLELSLQSGLPNDVDHAVNVCLLLSTEGRHTVDLHKACRMIDLLLAHIGIFEEDDLCMEDLYFSCWTKHSGRDFLRFWYESVKEKDIRSLITYKGLVYSQREMAGEDVLNLGRDIGVGDVEGQRVLQIGTFIRNLSFEECNQNILASSGSVFKFIILCLNNTYGNLRQMAFDTLANLASEICLVSLEDFNTQIMLNFIHDSLVSDDRFCLVRGMEVLSKLCQLPLNKSVMSAHIRNETYSRLIDMLTIQDIQIIVHSLEALYKLSKAGEPFTTKIAKVHKAIDTLVSLITIEAQSFGPGSLVGIKVVEYCPPPTGPNRDVVRKSTTVIQPVNPDCINIYQMPSSQLSQAGVPAEGKGAELPPLPKPKRPVTDIYPTTVSWLKASYETKKRSKVNQVELFSEYLQFCRKFMIDNALPSAEFLQMIKKIFDQAEVVSINRKNGDKDVFFEGFCKRSTQLPFAISTLPEDKVDKAISVNVSPQQTPPPPPPSHHVVTPTLRQRLMEPPRHSIHHPPLHTGASVAGPGTPKTSDNNPAAKPQTPQMLANRKPGRVIVTTPLAKGKRKLDEVPTPHPYLSNQPATPQTGQLVQNAPTVDGATGVSSDASCVKSLLAKKLCQSNSEPAALDANHPNSYQHSHNTITSQPFNASHSPGTFVVCPAVSSNSTNPNHRPIYQQGKSSSSGKSLPFQASSSLGQNTSTVSSSQSSLPHPVTLQPSALQPGTTLNNSHPKQAPPSVIPSAMSSVNDSNNYNLLTKPNAQNTNTNSVQAIQNDFSVNVSDNTALLTSNSQSCVQNGAGGQQGSNLSVRQPFARVINTSIAPQPQQISVQSVQQPLQHVTNNNLVTSSSFPNSGLAVMQQGANISVIPQQSGSVQNPNLITVGPQTAGVVQQPHQSVVSQTNPPSIAFNQLIHTPSNNVQVAGHHHQQQQPMLAPNVVSIANVTQSISSPAMTAVLASSGNQQGQGQQQMVLSSALQQATSGINRPALGGVSGVPSTVVFQTTPGTIVMPRQVLVQGNMGGVGTVQQRTAIGHAGGTVSFVVPQYRPTSSVIIQQSGAVNVLPSLALQPQQAIAQPNPAAQTLTGQMSTTLGTRQIVINQNQLPVGMQLSSLPGNGGSICLAPQQQPPQQPSNIVIQSNAILNQQQPSNNLQLNVNGTQVVRNESLSSRSDVGQNQLVLQEQQVQGQLPQQQQQNQLPNSQLIIQTSHHQSQQLPVTSIQCNGGNHEVNGILGSPDSMCSDLPPSPQSTGMQSDTLNGQLSDSDSSKSDLAKLVDKSGRPKINGIIHNFENGCYNNIQQQQPKISPTSTTQTNPPSVLKSEVSTNGMLQQSVQQENSTNPHIRVVNGIGMPMNSSDNKPQRIIVNVVQQPRTQQGINAVNGMNQQQQQQINVVGQQQVSGNVVFQQQQSTNAVLPQQQQQQQHFVNAPVQQQQQQQNKTIFQRVVMNSNASQQQPLQHPQIIKLFPKHLKNQQQNQNSSVSVSQPVREVSSSASPMSRPQTRISTLPCPSPAPAPSPVLNKITNTNSRPSPIITRPIPPTTAIDTSNNAVASDASKTPTRSGMATQTPTPVVVAAKRKAAMVAMVDKTPIRLRKKKGDPDTPGTTEGQGQKSISIVLEYKCEWGNCRRNFPSARHVFLHVFRQHIPMSKESCCQWFSCEKLVRKRWSLVSHIQDYHCSEMSMRSACHRRFTLSQNPSAPLPPPPPQPMVYPPDAASQAIRRFAIKPPFPEFAEQREGPVSKHIRLTAALILRNVCHHSALGRKLISRHESQLNYNCMSRMDSSTALSSCLWDILHYGESTYKSSTTASHLM